VPDDSSADGSGAIQPLVPGPKPAVTAASPGGTFQMASANRAAAFFTVFMHGKRFVDERGTRDAIRGPFFRDWFDSVLATRGWDDGDGFHVSYIGHPMEGAVFAFIQIENDPRYRSLRFGDGREYWISRLRALAFSTAWSTQWTLGPASESSLGNVQLYSSPGVVDLVGTPTLGVGWAIGEDFADRYVLERLERHTANRALLVVARSIGNPTRAMANMVGLKVPWYRDTRPGLFGKNFVARSDEIRERKQDPDGFSVRNALLAPTSQSPARVYPKEAIFEMEAGAHYESFLGGGSCIGGGGSAAFRVAPAWQIVTDFSGCLIINMPVNQSGDSIFYGAGPRWTPRASHYFSPYVQLLMGGRKVTHETQDPELRDKLQTGYDAGTVAHYPLRTEYQVEKSMNGFALLAGGGMDINVTPALTLRVASLEYSHSWLPPVDRIDASRGVRFSSGLVLRLGTW
jgi:hypothetical protein